ncbi:TPA: DUF342 domain-containing protein [Candidatus Poribacteria bacterium]|nr:DUF342 domain-containing protein [Candidatus Poribacteria bacterium]HEX29895.1 DUF342 domain-containing protein [Candidatus Poribacteria bacterium]
MDEGKIVRERQREIIEGDLRPTGSERFFEGDLIVTGNVRDGVSICVNGNVEVYGMVEAAIIRAYGDIIVHGGLPGRAYLDSGGSVIIHYANNSSIVSTGNIFIKTGATHCMLTADNEISLDPERGLLSGGIARAGNAITAATLGSLYKTETVLEVGITPIFRAESQRIAERIEFLREELDKTRKVFDLVVNSDPRFLSKRQLKLLDQIPLLQMKLSYLSKELGKYSRMYQSVQKAIEEDLSGGFIRVFRKVYPGVKITINFTSMQITDMLEDVIFEESGGRIRCRKPDGVIS